MYIGSNSAISEVMTFSFFQLGGFKLFDSQSEGAKTNLEYAHTVKSDEKNLTAHGHQFSVVGFKLMLERHYLPHVFSYYVTSSTFVLVSWVSFLISPEVIAGRMGMLITTLLVLVNLFGTIISAQPPSESLMVLGIWMMACIVLVKLALFAFAILLLKQRFCVLKTLEASRIKILQGDKSSDKTDEENAIKSKIDTVQWDNKCLYVFPLAFLLFNLMYWPLVFAKRIEMLNKFHSL